MAEPLRAAPALTTAELRRRAPGAEAPGVVLGVEPGGQVVSLAARNGQAEALAAAVKARFGAELPRTPRCHAGENLVFLWSGADRWLVLEPPGASPGPDLETRLREPLDEFATITEQSDSRVVLTVAGPCARDALARLVGIDLHPRAFRTGDTAFTLAAHTPVQLWQTTDAPRYAIAVARSLAGSLHLALCTASAAYGIDCQS